VRDVLLSLVVAAALASVGTRWATPDLDQNGDVDVADLLVLITAWGGCPDVCCLGDIDRDQVVGMTDLLELITWWNIYNPRTYPWCR